MHRREIVVAVLNDEFDHDIGRGLTDLQGLLLAGAIGQFLRLSDLLESIGSRRLAAFDADFAGAARCKFDFVNDLGLGEGHSDFLGVETRGNPDLLLVVVEHVLGIETGVEGGGAVYFHIFKRCDSF